MHWVIWLDPESDIFVVIDGNAMGYGMSDMMGMPLWVMEMSMLMFLCVFVSQEGDEEGRFAHENSQAETKQHKDDEVQGSETQARGVDGDLQAE